MPLDFTRSGYTPVRVTLNVHNVVHWFLYVLISPEVLLVSKMRRPGPVEQRPLSVGLSALSSGVASAS
ncbi:unannotated protein [freshwater metagenome]|uniref:Unannotated protein n=1 Tax=freshwater metagenome TaxID=449393 RepID=A0A6J7QL62_9ZZZZ